MITRKYKILVALTSEKKAGEKLLNNILINTGFAKIQSDAKKIIARDINAIDLDGAFFVAVYDFKFSQSYLTTQRLIRMAMQGIPIMVSARKIPNGILQFCEVYNYGER